MTRQISSFRWLLFTWEEKASKTLSVSLILVTYSQCSDVKVDDAAVDVSVVAVVVAAVEDDGLTEVQL